MYQIVVLEITTVGEQHESMPFESFLKSLGTFLISTLRSCIFASPSERDRVIEIEGVNFKHSSKEDPFKGE